MLLTREHETVEASGLGDGNNFTIAASAKAFEILSSNLYQNKILAVIRETVCNAADAHTVAGKPVTDIEVHLPTYGEPFFAVRDFGPGLSPRDTMTLYTTYFQSTKDTDANLIGGFGLGSKAPFAVADQFTVTSWHGGFKNTYVCFKQDGTPRVNMVGTEACGSATGLEVRVAVKATNLTAWMDNARTMFRWWPERARLNLDVLAEDIYGKPENVLLASDRMVDGVPAWAFHNYIDTSLVVMGKVAYQLTLSAIPNLPDSLDKLLRTRFIKLAVPMGAVEISPSREALSYSPHTCKALLAALDDMMQEARVKLTTLVDDAPTFAEARRRIYEAGNGYDSNIPALIVAITNNLKPLEWKGKPVVRAVNISLTAGFSAPVSVYFYEKRSHHKHFQRGSSYADSWTHVFPTQNQKRPLIWADKVTAKTCRTIAHNYKDSSVGKYFNAAIFTGVPYAELVAEFEKAGIPAPLNIETDLQAPPPQLAVKKGSKGQTTQYYAMGLNGNSWSWKLATTPLDMKGGGVYIRFDTGKPVVASCHREYASLVARGFIKGADRIVGISGSKLEKQPKLVKALEASGWQEMTLEYVRDSIDTKLLEAHVNDKAVEFWRSHDLGHGRYDIVRKAMDDGLSGKVWPGFQPLFDELKPHYNTFLAVKGSTYPIYRGNGVLDGFARVLSAEHVAIGRKHDSIVAKLREAWKEFADRHPLLAMLGNDAKPTVEVLRSYVNR